MRSLCIIFNLFLCLGVTATRLLERNLAYKSPFLDAPQVSIYIFFMIHNLHKRQIKHVRRQMQDAGIFDDKHYVTFYGGDFSNSPFIWSGGLNFTHADPFDTSVLLWTRAVPSPSSGTSQLPDQSVPVCLSYQVFKSADLSGSPVNSGEVFTSYDVDWTVKIEATGLQPDTRYFYRFFDCTDPTSTSPVGTTRTLPSPNTAANRVNGGNPFTLAVFSCSQYQAGWFNAYGYAAELVKPDIFVHLGDYYRTDESLRTAHLSGPWITVWYVADNAWKAGTADSNDTSIGCSFSPSGACFTDRKLSAVRAYHEWMPIRQVVSNDKLRIWRNFQIGRLMDLTMLDTRQYDRDLTDVYYNTVVNTVSSYENRSLMGAEQEKWFFQTLSESQERGAIWRIVGQQIVFTQLNLNGTCEPFKDAWDGYRANRRRVLDHLYGNKISNTVILAGDSHANWVSDLACNYNPISGEGAIGVEFGGTAVTSSSSFGRISQPETVTISQALVAINADLQWSEGFYRGFFSLKVDPRQLNATFYAMNDITNANLNGFASAEFLVKAGENKLSRPIAGGTVLAGALKTDGPGT
ncbi:PhoD-like phosphatase-domain-containing protein [Desarmillaria tabescens]|uniref:PhoD-like phosphatase-domain-containing protein n=1 Tax=Armillaria tabescens TaxID=1929756 RepID=A0AA39KEJ6_ARMTA|nr:PhoD-like phosphatase-domain-containing protein [Desarmillaria tabescens]KAK0459655.1 PhoD-like phosphatase-domain-containing protein [Desarmillaria tabescens]